MSGAARDRFLARLDARAAAGDPLRLWLRDDDAVAPTPALDRLLALTGGAGVPLVLAVIPEPTGPALAARLDGAPWASVALHGWSHHNHAPAGEKSQELGAHRPARVVLAELARGRARLGALHGARALPLLVPPWNRIDGAVAAGLPGQGITALSTFAARHHDVAGLHEVNTHLDIIDWRGSRGGRGAETLWHELCDLEAGRTAPLGVLTHHLVHDDAAWAFLDDLIAVTAHHRGCAWLSGAEVAGA
ncbi:polysaccharide deacetylase family protein [Frigidibacter sp. MR17.24]|uniref:polysaccharide deacetylase family protein n=1 Tax=Frigidibacter sp. MR17.24 TaxID=3127345 RepID=UPI003012D5CB